MMEELLTAYGGRLDAETAALLADAASDGDWQTAATQLRHDIQE